MTSTPLGSLLLGAALVIAVVPRQAHGQVDGSAPHETSHAAVGPVQAAADDDMVLDPAQPEFTVVNLPTTLGVRPGAGRFESRIVSRATSGRAASATCSKTSSASTAAR